MTDLAHRATGPTQLAAATLAAFFALTGIAHAVPAYAVQTGQACSTCHIGGFGPQLTPFGREFKLEGYTMRAGGFNAPLSAAVIASYLHTNADQPGAPAPHYAPNDNTTLDEASLYVAGGYGQHFGSFAQFTYDGVERSFAWDMLDVRAVQRATVFGKNAIFGVSVDNAPTLEDSWNTVPGWGFPYTDSGLAPSPGAATVVGDRLMNTVIGANVYGWWNSSVYGDVGLYSSPGKGFLESVGVHAEDTDQIDGSAPYWRFAYQKNLGVQNFEIGTFGLTADLYPGRDKSAGTTDSFVDWGFDASYQYTGGGKHIYTLNTRIINEEQHLAASRALGGASNLDDTLHDWRIDGSYYWHNTIGGTVGFFNTWGSKDALMYADNRTAGPDSDGFILQVDGTPFGTRQTEISPRLNLRVGLQYIAYLKFDGASTNYDGLGHDASDNDSIRLFTWLAF